MLVLDVGGGFPSGDLSPNIIQALSVTRDDPLGYRVIAEPGRHLSAHSFYLLTRVIGSNVKGGCTGYFLNESMYHSFMDNVLFGQTVHNTNQFYGRVSIASGECQELG